MTTTTYTTTEINGEWFVKNSNSRMIVNGPYKNEESAKRRVRDLKRRDAAQPSNIVDPADVTPEQRAFINSGYAVLHNPAMSREIVDDAIMQTFGDDWAGPDMPSEPYSDAWVADAYAAMDARKSRNGYRPAHRANRLRSTRK